VILSNPNEATMRSRPFSLVVAAAAGLSVFMPGTARAQQNSYRGYGRPGSYSPSNYGMMRSSGYTPSTYGMTRNSGYMPNIYGSPGSALNAQGSLTAGSQIPLGAVGALPAVAGVSALGSNLPPVLPATINPTAAPPGTLTPPPAMLATPEELGAAPAAAPATELPAAADTLSLQPAPTFAETPLASFGYPNALSTYGPPGAPTRAPVTLPYTGPQYQSQFYAPIRRVYLGY
jgi:hypothetical protein